jgi:hypothetical protein
MDKLCGKHGADVSCEVSMQVLGPGKDKNDVLRMPWLRPLLLQQMSRHSAKPMNCTQVGPSVEMPRLQTSTKPMTMSVMWRNLPNSYSRDSLLSLIDGEGFVGSYDFFYAPYDFGNNSSVGYALIHFISIEEAKRFFYHFQGFSTWNTKSGKVSEVTWSQPSQDLKGHIDRYRNSPVMHKEVSDEKKPLIFRDGRRVGFPRPTRRIHAPRLKQR